MRARAQSWGGYKSPNKTSALTDTEQLAAAAASQLEMDPEEWPLSTMNQATQRRVIAIWFAVKPPDRNELMLNHLVHKLGTEVR